METLADVAGTFEPTLRVYPAIHPSVLGCIVTGFAKGGTTLLKDVIVETTDMVGQFEGGLLMSESPEAGIPEPYAANLQEAWHTPPRFFDRYRRCETFEQAYRLLHRSSRALPSKTGPLVDKLPQYLVHLDDVMRRAPGTPVIVVVRNPVHVAVSWLDLGNTVDTTVAWVAAAAQALLAAIDHPRRPSPLYVVNFTHLVHDTNAAIRPLHAWLGLPHRPIRPTMTYGLPTAQSAQYGLPVGIEAERDDVPRRCSPERLAEIREAVSNAVPGDERLIGLRSGPVAGPAMEARRAA